MRPLYALCSIVVSATACASQIAAPTTHNIESSPTPTTTAITTPTTEARTLGRLEWGRTLGTRWTDNDIRQALHTAQSTDHAKQTKRVLEVAQQHIAAPTVTVRTINREGVLATDPKYNASDQALAGIDDPYLWAMCARVADAPLAQQCAARASSALDAWTSTYVPTGNPINDSFLVPLLQAIDLECPNATPTQCASWRAWAVNVATQEDTFYASLRPTDGRLTNNWMSWRLLIRGMSATIAGNDELVQSTRDLTTQHVARNIRENGSTIDFTERDALHYHVYDLEALVTLALFAPSAVDAPTKQAIERGVLFLQPFVLGQSQHIEFVHTTVPFDVQRKQAGMEGFSNTTWKVAQARPLLRLARTIFPSVQPWTGQIVDEQYSPRIKQIAALRAN